VTLWRNRSSARLLKPRRQSIEPIGFSHLIIEPPSRLIVAYKWRRYIELLHKKTTNTIKILVMKRRKYKLTQNEAMRRVAITMRARSLLDYSSMIRLSRRTWLKIANHVGSAVLADSYVITFGKRETKILRERDEFINSLVLQSFWTKRRFDHNRRYGIGKYNNLRENIIIYARIYITYRKFRIVTFNLK